MNRHSFRILLPFFWTSRGAGILNSTIFNSFHNRVEFGTILEGHCNMRFPQSCGLPVNNTNYSSTCCLHMQDKGKDESNRLFCIVFICPQRPQPEWTYFMLMLRKQNANWILYHTTLLYRNLHIFTATSIFHVYKGYVFSSDLTEIRTQNIKQKRR